MTTQKTFDRQTAHLLAVIGQNMPKLSGEEMQKWIQSPKSVQQALAEAFQSTRTEETYVVSVDYDLSLKGMIRKGAYDYVNPNITAKNFPNDREGEESVEVLLISYDKRMTPGEVLKDFDQRGLSPATLPEGFALAAKHPDIQREGPIILPGSLWRSRSGNRHVPALRGVARGRDLDLYWFGDRWSRGARFAAVRR